MSDETSLEAEAVKSMMSMWSTTRCTYCDLVFARKFMAKRLVGGKHIHICPNCHERQQQPTAHELARQEARR